MTKRKPITISRGQHLQLLGLEVLAKRHLEIVACASREMAAIVNETDEDGAIDPHGHMGDVVYESTTLNAALRNLNVKVGKK